MNAAEAFERADLEREERFETARRVRLQDVGTAKPAPMPKVCTPAPQMRLQPDRLTPDERKSYYAGDWLGAHPVKSKAIGRHASSDAEMAAEMLGRIRVEIENFGSMKRRSNP